MFRLALRSGLLAGLFIIVFSFLKSEWFYTGYSPDLFITCVALFFVLVGFVIRKNWKPDHANGEDQVQKRIQLLSRREMEVLELLFTKYQNKEIADLLHIELSTLKTHINSIYRKLEVTNRRDLCHLYRNSSILIN